MRAKWGLILHMVPTFTTMKDTHRPTLYAIDGPMPHISTPRVANKVKPGSILLTLDSRKKQILFGETFASQWLMFHFISFKIIGQYHWFPILETLVPNIYTNSKASDQSHSIYPCPIFLGNCSLF